MAGEPIATGADDDDKPSGASSSGDFVIRHWSSSPPAARDPSLRAFLPASRPRALDVGRAASFPSCGGWDRLSRRPRAEEDGGATGGYISLRDLIDFLPTEPSAAGARSPGTPRGVGGVWEIQIKNHLVKQAAYAYLQPTPSASESDHCRRRLTLRRVLSLLTCGLAVDTLDLCIAFLRRLFRHPR